jgi:hypothetical protein
LFLFCFVPAKSIQPCPVPAFSSSEYDTMWAFTVVPGIMGFFLNGFMLVTWLLGGKELMEATPTALQNCVVVGLLYNLVET